MIKVISFDIGGTLLRYGTNNSYSMKNLSMILNLPYDKVNHGYKNIFQKRKGTFDELIDMFCLELGIVRNEKIEEFFDNKFNMDEGSINEECLDVIKKLKNLGYKIILLSNSSCLFNNKIDNLVTGFVDKIYYSYQVGYTKSDRECYRYVEHDLGYLPEEFLHIGDTIKSDYIYPIENGWKALYYGNIDNKDIISINNFYDILKYLDDRKIVK